MALEYKKSEDPRPKVRTIQNFVSGLSAFRSAVKADATTLLSRIDLQILSDRDSIVEYLSEMTAVILEKHLLSPQGKVQPNAAKLVKDYVAGMARSAS